MIVRREPQFVRRRWTALAVLLVVLMALVLGVTRLFGGPPQASASPHRSGTSGAGGSFSPGPAPTPTTSGVGPTRAPSPGASGPSGAKAATASVATLIRRTRITGTISPKSVVASPKGIVFAQNMMYTHTVTAYQPDGSLTATIRDGVDLSAFGVKGHPGTSKGAPVEAAFTHDGRFAYVTNYSMYGAGFGPEGKDSCTAKTKTDPSFVYRIDTATFAIDQVIAVGAVPKYVAVTPDDKTLLVTNWCSSNMSVVDTTSAKQVAAVPLGSYPRGIAVSADSRTAYVAVMGADKVDRVDLATRKATLLATTGNGPRHIVISPDGRTLYISNNGSGTVSRVDSATGKVLQTVSVSSQPRSMAISSDGTALFVVSYGASTVTALRASDLAVLQRVRTDSRPIGITYEPTQKAVWVACYGGSILVFDDSTTTAASVSSGPAATSTR